MPPKTNTFQARPFTWRIAALWLVVLALGLALSGIVLAVVQSRSLAARLMAPLETQAADIADRALQNFETQTRGAVECVARHLYDESQAEWVPPSSFPRWLDGLYVWNGDRLTVVSASTDARGGIDAAIAARLRARFETPVEASVPDVDLSYDSLDDSPLVLACLKSTAGDGTPIVIAGIINLPRLRSELIEPLLPNMSGLELVVSKPDVRHAPWSQRLLSAMRYWEIKPTDAFIRSQQKTVLHQTLFHVGLTLFALVTLLLAMWVFVRVVRREMALTQMKANFVADVSHELKTPLALIRMFGETLQSGRVTSDEKRREYYDIITRESTRLTNLIENILDFSRIDSGRQLYDLQPTDIAAVVRQTYETYKAQLDQAGFEHQCTAASTLPLVDADADAIAQAMINLISNVIKYSDEDRYLGIELTEDTRRGGPGVLISVHDRGIGIKPEDRAHLFDGFFRAGDARVREQGGTGLGLALVKHIVAYHRGSIEVRSRLVKGSTFQLFLPASGYPSPEAQKKSPQGSNDSESTVQ
jgi:signal transduction histidine kinase